MVRFRIGFLPFTSVQTDQTIQLPPCPETEKHALMYLGRLQKILIVAGLDVGTLAVNDLISGDRRVLPLAQSLQQTIMTGRQFVVVIPVGNRVLIVESISDGITENQSVITLLEF